MMTFLIKGETPRVESCAEVVFNIEAVSNNMALAFLGKRYRGIPQAKVVKQVPRAKKNLSRLSQGYAHCIKMLASTFPEILLCTKHHSQFLFVAAVHKSLLFGLLQAIS
jgi:hypothetical protein